MKTQSIHSRSKGINVTPEKYDIIKKALLEVLSYDKGVTFEDIRLKVAKKITNTELFPKPNSVGWYAKTVQLDLEKKGIIERIADTKPLQFRKKK